MAKNHHWRCGELNKTTGRPCKNIVRVKGELCYRHINDVEPVGFPPYPDGLVAGPMDGPLVGVTKALEDDLFEKLTIYVQRLKDENELLRRELAHQLTIIKNISGVIAGEY